MEHNTNNVEHTRSVALQIPDSQHAILRKLAYIEGNSVAAQVRQALKAYLQDKTPKRLGAMLLGQLEQD